MIGTEVLELSLSINRTLIPFMSEIPAQHTAP